MKKMKQVGQIYGTEKEPNPQAGRVYDADGLSPSLDTMRGGNRMPKIMEVDDMGLRIRKLTPKECMRLQGVDDAVTDKLIEADISDSQLYRAAGDAVTVTVVYEIAKAIRKSMEETTDD